MLYTLLVSLSGSTASCLEILEFRNYINIFSKQSGNEHRIETFLPEGPQSFAVCSHLGPISALPQHQDVTVHSSLVLLLLPYHRLTGEHHATTCLDHCTHVSTTGCDLGVLSLAILDIKQQ